LASDGGGCQWPTRPGICASRGTRASELLSLFPLQQELQTATIAVIMPPHHGIFFNSPALVAGLEISGPGRLRF
jgi:hypothetical protein